METPRPNTADLDVTQAGAPARKPLSAVLAGNFDVLALAFGVIACFVTLSATPEYSCGTSYVEETSSVFNAFSVLSPLAFALAAVTALACRRHIAAKIAACVVYGGASVPVFVGLALAGAPCAFS